MTNTARFADHAAKQRRLALNDAIDMTRRAAAAAQAAATGDSDACRTSIVVDAQRRLVAVLRELQALT